VALKNPAQPTEKQRILMNPAPAIKPETISMTARDGTRLDADIYRPAGDGPYPVLLMRQPYGRKIASTVVYAHPAWYAAHGYVAVIQDVRGRGSSEGKHRLFRNDVEDGYDTLDWASKLPGTTGKVGMYGFSYQGVTQWLALASGHEALSAISPAMCAWDVRTDWAYEGDAFCYAGGMGWAMQMAAEQARLAGDAQAFSELSRAAANPPYHEPYPYMPEIMERYGHYCHYQNWVAHPEADHYWDGIAPRAALERAAAGDGVRDIPMLLVGGWYDSFLKGTLSAWQQMSEEAETMRRLVIGPWTHLPWGRHVGGVDFGEEAVGDIDRLQIAWFDYHLKGKRNGLEETSPVHLFDLAAKTWRGFDAWPGEKTTDYHLHATGLAATHGPARLSPEKPGPVKADIFVHDPWRPVPSLGGHNTPLGGMRERGALDDRTDVIAFETALLDKPLRLAGEVSATLGISADAESFDVSCVLSQVTESGQVFNLTQGYRRLTGAQTGPVEVPMRALCAEIPAGHALRLSIAGADFPAFAVNPGISATPVETRLIDNLVITLALATGGDTECALHLPIPPSKDE